MIMHVLECFTIFVLNKERSKLWKNFCLWYMQGRSCPDGCVSDSGKCLSTVIDYHATAFEGWMKTLLALHTQWDLIEDWHRFNIILWIVHLSIKAKDQSQAEHPLFVHTKDNKSFSTCSIIKTPCMLLGLPVIQIS